MVSPADLCACSAVTVTDTCDILQQFAGKLEEERRHYFINKRHLRLVIDNYCAKRISAIIVYRKCFTLFYIIVSDIEGEKNSENVFF